MSGPGEGAERRVAAALAAMAAGRPVLVVDDDDRENEGDLVLAADAATPEAVAFVLRHTSGLICVALTGERCDALGLPPMVADNDDPHGTAFTVTVDAREGTTTGISAADRARTVALLGDPTARAEDLRRPGHVLPLRARDGGVLERRGHTEAAVDLARLAGRSPAGLICEVVSPDHSRMADADELRALAVRHDLPLLSVADLVAWRAARAEVRRVVTVRLPTRHGDFTAHGYRGDDGREHLALVLGDPDGGVVHLHRECLAGDPFTAATRCDCRRDLDAAQAAVSAAGHGAVVYVRAPRGTALDALDPVVALHAARCRPAHPGTPVPRGSAAGRARAAGHGLPDPDLLAVGAAVLRDLGVARAVLGPGDPADPAAPAERGVTVTGPSRAAPPLVSAAG